MFTCEYFGDILIRRSIVLFKIGSRRVGILSGGGGRRVMAARRSSDNVVMPDITEVSEADQLTAVAEHRGERDRLTNGVGGKTTRITNAGTADANGVVTVPVSLPVGTLITGTTFNVITSDQLPHFKPMLCVDNGFISGGGVGDELKTTHLVLASDKQEEKASRTENTRSWADTVHMPVLPIRCKNTSADLHKMKFGSGGRGKCIKYGHEWYTPSEFEALCGRASSKDWKRSIRFGGRSIQALIDEGILTPHATSCTCGACCDDQSAMGPVRLFTPYKRRRRHHNLQDSDDKKPKIKRDASLDHSDEVDNIHQTNSNSHSKEDWQTLAEGLDSNNDYHLLTDATDGSSDPNAEISDMNAVLKRLDDISSTLVRLGTELKQCVEDVTLMSARQIARMEQERTSALLAASVEASVDADQVPLHVVEDAETKKCANCNREASAECSLCRRTPYCSTYCQKKDWASHQIECLRSVPLQADPQHQSIMLIVESQHQ